MPKNNISRRNFVLKSAAGISSLAVTNYLPQLNNNTLKTGKDLQKVYTKHFSPEYIPTTEHGDIVLENDQVRLIIGGDGTSKSLVSKATSEECLIMGKSIPISTIIQERPFQNEIKLAYPCDEKIFRANSIQKEGDLLIIGYELIPYKATIRINKKPGYIGFTIEDFIITEDDYLYGHYIIKPPVWKISFLQLPLRERTYYGDWLQVVWDDKVATNILSTDPFARIEAERMDGFYLLKAGAERDVKLKGVSAALITCTTNKLLDNIAQVEEGFDLAPGVKSRRSKEYKYSYYWTGNINPDNLDQHLKYAKMAGFHAMQIYYFAFLKRKGYINTGDYEWDPKYYPNGKKDFKQLLNKIKKEGISPGIHFLHTFIGLNSKYVSPVPDHRMNLAQLFTLSSPLSRDATTIYVDEDPGTIRMADNRRVLKVGSELISYTGYTDTRPYQITGCSRGAFHTNPNDHPMGLKIGVLDISEFGAQSVYINQDNDLQDEIAEKIADFYDAGFEFCYYDGSEGVNPPFWCNVARAQWRVHKRLNPQPLFAEGAAKTHFSWHILSRGNAFDVFKPEVLKQSIREHPAAEAPRMKENFGHLDFGWLGYFVPSEKTVGTQPDMLEYATSRAAAWDCPISLQASLEKFKDHQRTPDNLEVLRRWEEVRINDWLTQKQKSSLQNLEQEHILLINEKNKFELRPYDQIINVANKSREVRAFIFERKDSLYVVYWHISGSKRLELPLKHKNMSLMDNLQRKSSVAILRKGKNISIPVSNRRFIEIKGIERDKVIQAFQDARIVT